MKVQIKNPTATLTLSFYVYAFEALIRKGTGLNQNKNTFFWTDGPAALWRGTWVSWWTTG